MRVSISCCNRRKILNPPQWSSIPRKTSSGAAACHHKLSLSPVSDFGYAQQSSGIRLCTCFWFRRERQEAKRKAIQAGGIASFQNIVSGEISEAMLRWKGIEATESMADNSNPKTLVIGGGKGTPIILGDENSPHVSVGRES